MALSLATASTSLASDNRSSQGAETSPKSATTMPSYAVFPIEPPVSPFQLAAFKTLRLTSLQIDPQAFLSTYAHEVTFSDNFWRGRLDSPFQQTLIASVLEDDHKGGDVETRAPETGEWIGMASIVGPSDMSPSILAPFKEAGVGANWQIYGLYGMWVHPAHRGKGVGTQLVEACLEWARTNVDVKFLGDKGGDFGKVVVLLVYDDNIAGRTLYSRAGFTNLEEVRSVREGEIWMLANV